MRDRVSTRVSVVVVLVALLGALLPGVAGATPTGPPNDGWRDGLAAASVDPAGAAPTDLKARIAGDLAPLADTAGALTTGDVQTLADDAAGAYADDVRLLPETIRTVLGDDQRVAAGLQARLNDTPDDPLLLAAAADLLAADRASATVMVADATLLVRSGPGGDHADETALTQAQRFLDQAADAWSRGQPLAVIEPLEQAMLRAADVLANHGISYAPGADADGDGLADLLEFRIGSDPRVGDTDGDGLGDAFEAGNIPYHLPTVCRHDRRRHPRRRQRRRRRRPDRRPRADTRHRPADPGQRRRRAERRRRVARGHRPAEPRLRRRRHPRRRRRNTPPPSTVPVAWRSP